LCKSGSVCRWETSYGSIEYYVMESITIYTVLNKSAAPQTDWDKLWKTHMSVQGKGNTYWETQQKMSLGRIQDNIKNSKVHQLRCGLTWPGSC
jgi:hypothetical protein